MYIYIYTYIYIHIHTYRCTYARSHSYRSTIRSFELISVYIRTFALISFSHPPRAAPGRQEWSADYQSFLHFTIPTLLLHVTTPPLLYLNVDLLLQDTEDGGQLHVNRLQKRATMAAGGGAPSPTTITLAAIRTSKVSAIRR